MANGNGFTPTEQRIIDKLSDGGKHKRDELLKCLDDSQATAQNLYGHISNIRKKLNPAGRDVVYHSSGRGWSRYYQLVMLISTDE